MSDVFGEGEGRELGKEKEKIEQRQSPRKCAEASKMLSRHVSSSSNADELWDPLAGKRDHGSSSGQRIVIKVSCCLQLRDKSCTEVCLPHVLRPSHLPAGLCQGNPEPCFEEHLLHDMSLSH